MPALSRGDLSPNQARLSGQIASYTRWSRASLADRQEQGQTGQQGLRARFAREIDPDGALSDAELAARVDAALKAHMARLALASSKARMLRQQAGRPADGAAP